MKKLTIIGCGGVNTNDASIRAYDIMIGAGTLVFQTSQQKLYNYISNEKNAITLDSFYENAPDFDVWQDSCVKRILSFDDVVVCLVGDGVYNSLTSVLCKKGREQGFCIQVISNKASDVLSFAMEKGLIGNQPYTTICGYDFTFEGINTNHIQVITEIDCYALCCDIKLDLLRKFPPQHKIALEQSGKFSISTVEDIDKQGDYANDFAICVPCIDLLSKESYDYMDLVNIVKDLRKKCPWDKEQTHKSIKSNLIEETYELYEAIDADDEFMLQEELGDVLLQVALHTTMEEECGHFDQLDVTSEICRKLIRRHPHVYGDVEANDPGIVLKNWDKIKLVEHGYTTKTQELKHIAACLPSLMRATKLQKKASKFGLEFKDIEAAYKEFYAKMEEFKNQPENQILAGQAMFALNNVFRLLKLDSEILLTDANNRFIQMFEKTEKQLGEKNFSQVEYADLGKSNK